MLLDFSKNVASINKTPLEVEENLVSCIKSAASVQHDLDISTTKSKCQPGEAILEWMTKLREKDGNKKIVLLIDEYDDPMTTFLPHAPETVDDHPRTYTCT